MYENEIGPEIREHFDELIDNGKEQQIYAERGCNTPSHNPRSKSCIGCRFHEIQKRDSKMKRVGKRKMPEPPVFHDERPIRLPSSYMMPQTLTGHHCMIADYTSARRKFYKTL